MTRGLSPLSLSAAPHSSDTDATAAVPADDAATTDTTPAGSPVTEQGPAAEAQPSVPVFSEAANLPASAAQAATQREPQAASAVAAKPSGYGSLADSYLGASDASSTATTQPPPLPANADGATGLAAHGIERPISFQVAAHTAGSTASPCAPRAFYSPSQ